MSIDEYRNIDKDFDLEVFLSRVSNMFIKFYSSISFEKLDTVRHFVSSDVYSIGSKEIADNISNNVRHMYDMLNVKESKIIDIVEEKDSYVIKVLLTGRYLDYYVDRNTKKYVSGNDKTRVEYPYLIELTKRKDAKELKDIKKCPTCGASLLINNSGKCEYCGSTYNLVDYDFIITKIVKS